MSASPETLEAAPFLRGTLRSRRLTDRWLWGDRASARIAELAWATRLDGAPPLAGASALVRMAQPLNAALALAELDGLARRIVLCPPDLADEHLPGVIRGCEADIVVSDSPELAVPGLAFSQLAQSASPVEATDERAITTEWVLFTSGTSGPPKLAVHTLAGLSGAIRPGAADYPPIWGTFYDIRRYGGLQILLRALLGEGSLVVSGPDEAPGGYLARLAAHGATHITGTPSHWRRTLMTPASAALAPRYVRLSGEIADQAVLDALGARFPGVPIGHAYASTEAGVGFEVTDGREGFPASFMGAPGDVELRIRDGGLQLRSTRTALRYLGADAGDVRTLDGWVDTGDLVEQRGERFHFAGRRTGVINVGGLKAHPETIEAALNQHPAVRMSRARPRKSPILGAIVAAEVVLTEPSSATDDLKAEILDHCRRALAPHMRPAVLNFVPSLPISAGGKLERRVA